MILPYIIEIKESVILFDHKVFNWRTIDFRPDIWKIPLMDFQTNRTTNSRKFLEQETYRYAGILESDTFKQEMMKEKKFKKQYLKWTRKLENKLCSKIFILRIRTIGYYITVFSTKTKKEPAIIFFLYIMNTKFAWAQIVFFSPNIISLYHNHSLEAS